MFAASKTASVSGGYQISRSLRFNSADSTYLSKTWAGNGSRTTATASFWVKKSSIAAEGRLIAFDSTGSGTIFWLFFNTSDQLQIYTSGTAVGLTTTQVFRDPSAWYHIVVGIDTTQATGADRIKLYVNGSQVTAFTGTQTYYSQNATIQFNNTSYTGYVGFNNSNAPSGYMTELNWIDGTQLTPSSFGETNAQTGVWQPKLFTGSYGTNGFYLNFSDNSNTTAATLGKDYSGNGNNWTPNNFSVTAGSGNDSLVDSPTSYGTDTGVGGTVRGNYCTFNPLQKGADVTLTEGNLKVVGGYACKVLSTIGMSSGTWYCEMVMNSGTNANFGLARFNTTFGTGNYLGDDTTSWCYATDGKIYTNGTGTVYGNTYTVGDVIGISFDADVGTLKFYKNGTVQNSGTAAVTGLTSGPYFFAQGASSSNIYANFGQRPFAYTAPSGFKALCTQNLPTPTIGATSATQAGKYFNPVLYTGTGSNLAVTGVGFQPDWIWTKARSAVDNHIVVDAIRGIGNILIPNSTAAESAYGAFVSFNSDGFTKAAAESVNGRTYVAWNWKANGSGSSNTAGSITSTVSASTTSGFSIVTYTGNGTNNATVGHGLGATPSMIIIKQRNAARDWPVYHVGYASAGVNDQAYLNLTNAAVGGIADIKSVGSSTFALNTWVGVNGSGNTYVAYCFAPIAGYSAFGSYTGNGSADGAFVFTGFRPAFILYKRSSDAGNSWRITDSTRSTYNLDDTAFLYPDTNETENFNANDALDILSNGFKIRTANAPSNASGSTYIYMAFASSPFKYSLAR